MRPRCGKQQSSRETKAMRLDGALRTQDQADRRRKQAEERRGRAYVRPGTWDRDEDRGDPG